jgi:uncharacterized membrane protein YhaH (DUF805 family)
VEGAVMERFAGYFSFYGRTSRLGYWRIQIAVLGIFAFVILTLFAAIAAVGAASTVVGWILLFLVALPCLWAFVAMGVRRLHDRGRRGWWLLVFWVAPSALAEVVEGMTAPPLVWIGFAISLGSLALALWGLVELGFLKGTTGANRYGDDPVPMPVDAFA